DAIALGAKEDGRGDDTGAGAIVKGTYSLSKQTVSIMPGDIYIPLDQPLAGLVAALLEPESDARLVANKLVPAEQGALLPISRLRCAARTRPGDGGTENGAACRRWRSSPSRGSSQNLQGPVWSKQARAVPCGA